MSVRENLAFGLKLRKVPEAEIASRVAQAADLLEIQPLLDRRPKALSGGQRQRVAIGRTIVRHPKVFLFDEPLSNLDTALRVQMRGELSRLHRRLGATMVYVTHDQVEAMTLATRVAVFNQGVLQQAGPPLELYHRPANRFVAGFFGSPAMNFLPVRCEGGRLIGRGFDFPIPDDLPNVSSPDLQVGIRPQELILTDSGAISGEVEAIERLGFDGYAFLSTEAGGVAARFAKGVEVAVGDRVHVAAVSDALHVFAADGRALRHPSSLA
jgi:multiple sugar transport system ATP-binding protein